MSNENKSVMLNETLKSIREFNRFTQTELASKLNVNKSTISEIESGKKNVSYKMLEKYSELFGIPISSIELLKDQLERRSEEAIISDKITAIFRWVVSDEECFFSKKGKQEINPDNNIQLN